MKRAASLSNASAFIARGPVAVYDGRGAFYAFGRPGQSFRFNLPPGRYVIEGDAQDAGPMTASYEPKEPAVLPGFVLPPSLHVQWCDSRDMPIPGQLGQIARKEGIVFLNNDLKEQPSFVQVYILYHEIGHYFHKEEIACDRFAMDQMIARGYNPSQVHLASKWTLKASPMRSAQCYEHAKTY